MRLKDLVERCWDADYDKRPNFDEICDILEEEAGKLGGSRMTRGPASGANMAVGQTSSSGGSGGGGCCSLM